MKALLPLVALSCAWCLPASAVFDDVWQETITGSSAICSPLGDVDGDGDTDAVLVHIEHPGQVLLNNGNARFDASPTASLIPAAGSAELGDLDGDGDLDLFLAVHLGPCEVWLNDGAGNFTDSGQSIAGNRSRTGVALADLDGDLDLDVVLPTNDPDFPSEVWKNNGAGVFSNSGQALGNEFAQNVAVGDIDGDADKDILFANNGTNTIWKNNGSAVFTLSPDTVGGETTFAIGLADLDGDTDLDAFVVNGVNPPFTMPNEVWKNNGSGVFTNTGQALGTDYSLSVALEDVDGDGDKDAVVGTNNTMPNRLFLNNGSGTFAQQALTLGTGSCFGIRAADLDGDGDKDYFLPVNGGPSEVWRRVPIGQGFLTKTNQNLGSMSVGTMAKGDFDGDGDLDVMLGSNAGNLRLIRNDGTGQFVDTTVLLSTGYGNANAEVLAGDLDGDGDLDLFTVQSITGGEADMADRAWFNNGTGIFTPGVQSFPGQAGGAGALADLDGDGDLDVVVGNYPFGLDNGQNRVLLNNGSGTFASSAAFGTGNVQAIAVGDLDGSGGPDVFVGDYGAASSVWLKSGANWVATGQAIGTGEVLDVVLHDFDADGDLDAFCARDSGGSKLYLNNGSGTFSDSGQSFGAFKGQDAELIDADGDGDQDLWVGNGGRAAQPDQLWRNSGGTFTLESSYGNQTTGAVVAGDFDANGRLDVFAASFRGDHVFWANQTPGVIQNYAGSFGLSGADTDPLADPDHDGVLNFEEMAFNMNPNLADAAVIGNLATAVKGLPKIRCVVAGATRTFIAETIRRKSVPALDYRLQVGADLIFTGKVAATVTTSALNADYERATYTWIVPGTPLKRFGRFGVFYDP
jgi:hypothetical protein